jgi:hypothetical protein
MRRKRNPLLKLLRERFTMPQVEAVQFSLEITLITTDSKLQVNLQIKVLKLNKLKLIPKKKKKRINPRTNNSSNNKSNNSIPQSE